MRQAFVGARAEHTVRDEKQLCVVGERVLHAHNHLRERIIGKLGDLIDVRRPPARDDCLWSPGDRHATYIALLDDAPQFMQNGFIDAILGVRIVQSQYIDVIRPQAPQALDDRSFDMFRVQPVFVRDSLRLGLSAAPVWKRLRHGARCGLEKAHQRRNHRPRNSELRTDRHLVPAAAQEFSQDSFCLAITIGRCDVIPANAALERMMERPKPLSFGKTGSKRSATETQSRDLTAEARNEDRSHADFSRLFISRVRSVSVRGRAFALCPANRRAKLGSPEYHALPRETQSPAPAQSTNYINSQSNV